MLGQVEAGNLIQELKMDVLQAIQFIIKSWNEVTTDTIQNCWNHVKILSNIFDDDLVFDDEHILDDELDRAIKDLRLPNRMQMKDFLTIPDENVIYEIPDVSEFADLFKNRSIDPDETDDSVEAEKIYIKQALQSLKTVNLFLLQQENASKQINLVSKIENFIKKTQINFT